MCVPKPLKKLIRPLEIEGSDEEILKFNLNAQSQQIILNVPIAIV